MPLFTFQINSEAVLDVMSLDIHDTYAGRLEGGFGFQSNQIVMKMLLDKVKRQECYLHGVYDLHEKIPSLKIKAQLTDMGSLDPYSSDPDPKWLTVVFLVEANISKEPITDITQRSLANLPLDQVAKERGVD
jgi:hypothetical protein